MRLICSSNGKLELKKNAATGYWGSVNRIASLSRHQSFLSTTPLSVVSSLNSSLSSSDGSTGDKARRMSRADAAKRYVRVRFVKLCFLRNTLTLALDVLLSGERPS